MEKHLTYKLQHATAEYNLLLNISDNFNHLKTPP